MRKTFPQADMRPGRCFTRTHGLVVLSIIALAMIITAVLSRRHAAPLPSPAAEYADSATCISCHAGEAAGYARTGMAHAFSTPHAPETVDAPARQTQFYHAASATYYSMTAHDGRLFQRRWQQGYDGHPDNVEELPIDYIMGSGNHVRTYLHREQDGTLIELPLAWYAEEGGHFGMNPGYDNAHPMTRRPIAYECMFCHNAYPQIPATLHRDLSANPVYSGALPEGIDCQRCHGPGAAHVQAARKPGTSLQEIRARILNPIHLSHARQMEVCEQCHLETTSHSLPDRIRRYDREPFSYKATEPLASFNSYFDRDASSGSTGNFEIVSGAYRLRQSQCYLKSQGALTCETCHNPHDLHKGRESAAYYTAICMRCHAATLPAKIAARQHPVSPDCVSCHMPQRRTEDVVHAVMTDHLIQRQPPPAVKLLAARAELEETPANAYRGEVKRYLLDHETSPPDTEPYNALAQIIDGSNLDAGIPRLTQILESNPPPQPNPFVELGDAQRRSSNLSGAIESYRRALAIDPHSSRAQRRLGVTLGSAGQTDAALNVLGQAIEREPNNPLLWYEQAIVEARSGNTAQAIADLRKSLELKPGYADAQNNLGANLARSGDVFAAEAAFRAALAINPYDAGTLANLGRLLAGRGDWKQAAFQLQKAVQLDLTNADAAADYAVSLQQMGRLPEAQRSAEIAVMANPQSARGHDLLGQIEAEQGKTVPARFEFESALKLDPRFAPAQLDLAEVMLRSGQPASAASLLQQAERAGSPAIAARARLLLAQMSRR